MIIDSGCIGENELRSIVLFMESFKSFSFLFSGILPALAVRWGAGLSGTS